MKNSLYFFTLALFFQVGYIIIKNINNKNNVCTTFADYYTNRDKNKNCYYNPDYTLTAPEIILRYGYSLEIYNVTTDDGYILTLFRIPYGRNGSTLGRRYPVFIQHGFVSNSASFVSLGRKSLGFILANEGYDVWMGNFRGTKYSRAHVNLSTSDSNYWNFTVHEYGVYDLPALIDFISNTTKLKITVIGYSTGITAMLIYGTTYSDIASQKVSLMIALAPATYVSKLMSHLLSFPLMIAKNFFDKVYLPMTFMHYLCFPYPIQMRICLFPACLLSGLHFKELDPETLPSVLKNTGDDVIPFKALEHILQIGQTRIFTQFRYDSETNFKVYGTVDPPSYNLSLFNIHTYLIRGANDVVVSGETVQKLHSALPKHINLHDIYVIEDDNFNHLDFLTEKDVDSLLYWHIVNFIKNSHIF